MSPRKSGQGKVEKWAYDIYQQQKRTLSTGPYACPKCAKTTLAIVIDKKKKCTDCHLFSIQHDTTYTPLEQKGLGVESVFIPDPKKHLNGISGDIAFKQKIQNAGNPGYDTLFIWDPIERSCSNIRCHPPWHPKKLLWKKVKRK